MKRVKSLIKKPFFSTTIEAFTCAPYFIKKAMRRLNYAYPKQIKNGIVRRNPFDSESLLSWFQLGWNQ